MLTDTTARQVTAYFAQHPVLSRYADRICIALTGSYAFGLGGKGADVDAKVLCPPDVYDLIRQENGTTEEEFPDVVGDYTLECLTTIWNHVNSYAEMTSLFIYGNLVYLAGDRTLLDPLVAHCRHLPPDLLTRETEREQTELDQHLYAFLRSFQTEDPVARLLARAGMIRSAMRLTFLADGAPPPYDKHLFRLLPRTTYGRQIADLIADFLDHRCTYAEVAATDDWHAMYEAAAETPACQFRKSIRRVLGGANR